MGVKMTASVSKRRHAKHPTVCPLEKEMRTKQNKINEKHQHTHTQKQHQKAYKKQQNLKLPKIPEESSDFDDFWTVRIVMTRSII